MAWTKYHTLSLIWALFIMTPMYFFVVYHLISHSNPDRLVWFIFWAYIPILIIGQILAKVAESKNNE